MNKLYDDTISDETALEWLFWMGETTDITEEFRYRGRSVLRYYEREKRHLMMKDQNSLTFADHRCLQAYSAVRASLVRNVGWGWLEGL